MLKLAGCGMVMAGCLGTALVWCRDFRQRLLLLKEIRTIYEDLKYYISYQKITVPDALFKLSENRNMFFSAVFLEIYEEQQEGREEFPGIYARRLRGVLLKTPLKKEEGRLLLAFPSCLGFMEERAQAGALDELLRETTQRIKLLEEEQKNKNKMVISLGLAVGGFLSILLI